MLKASTALYPDIIAASLMAASTYFLIYRERFKTQERYSIIAPLLASVLLFLAFLAKESAYWVAPFWFFSLFQDLRKPNRDEFLWKFYAPVFVSGIAIGVIYLFLCNVIWGNPLSRIQAVQDLTGKHLWSWDRATRFDLIKRLTYSPAVMLLKQYGLAAIIAIFGYTCSPKYLRPWGLYTLLSLFLFWFGSTSFSQYEPMPLMERMSLPIAPGIYIFASLGIVDVYDRMKNAKETKKPLLILLALAMLIPFVIYIPLSHKQYAKSTSLAEKKAMAFLSKEFKSKPAQNFLLITSDNRSHKHLSYYFGYEYPKNVKSAWVNDIDSNTIGAHDLVFILVNKSMSDFLSSAYGAKNYDAEISSLGLPILLSKKRRTVV